MIREHDSKCGTSIATLTYLDTAPVPLSEFPTDSEPDPRAGYVPAVKALKDPKYSLAMFHWYANTVVCDLEPPRPLRAVG
jgi:hypothetical protein